MTPQLEARSLALPSQKHLTTTPQWSSFVWGTHSKQDFKTVRMANHSQDERPWRVRLSQHGELPLPFLCLWFWLFLFISFAAGRRGRRAGRQRCLKVQSDPSAGLMLCSDISSSTISLLFDVADACRGGLSFHAVKSSMRKRRQEWNFNDLHAFGSSRLNILNQIRQMKPHEPDT